MIPVRKVVYQECKYHIDILHLSYIFGQIWCDSRPKLQKKVYKYFRNDKGILAFKDMKKMFRCMNWMNLCVYKMHNIYLVWKKLVICLESIEN